MITTYYPPYNFGGDGIFVYRLSHELARRGHKVDVIHCIDAYRIGTRQRPTTSYASHPNITVHSLKSHFGFLSPLFTHQTGLPFFKTIRIKQILDKGFDVIHYHNISLVGGPKILEYGRAIKLYTLHEYWLICPTNVLFKYKSAVCARPSCLICTLLYKRPPQWWRYLGLLKKSIKHVDTFIAPSRFIKNLHHRMGLNISIVHLPYFIPEVPFTNHKQSSSAENKEPYFLYVGRIEKLKGPQTLIPIFYKYFRARLLIVGTGTFESRLRQMIKGSTNIKFLRYQSQEQLQKLYQEAVALIVPSIWYDVYPQVMIEAYRQKTPIIVRNLGGMPECVKESDGGLVYDTNEDLLAKMDHLLEDQSYRHKLGLCGFKACQEKWSLEVHMKKYFSLLSDIAVTKGLDIAKYKSVS